MILRSTVKQQHQPASGASVTIWRGAGNGLMQRAFCLLFLLAPAISFAQSSTPYGGTARAVPGRIEAEHYDVGGEGVAYHDTDATNSGGALRSDGVDLIACTDSGCGQALSAVAVGEWLKYTVSVATTGTYTLNARVSSIYSGSGFHLDVDGQDATGLITLPNTGSATVWQTASKNRYRADRRYACAARVRRQQSIPDQLDRTDRHADRVRRHHCCRSGTD